MDIPEKQKRIETQKQSGDKFVGVIIEESLVDNAILQQLKIIKTKVEKVTPAHHTPYLKKWTLHTIEVSESNINKIAKEISSSIDTSHGNWYADFKNEKWHYIIFHNKVFKISRTSKEQYDEAKKYGIALGIPTHQVDFRPDVKEWKR